MSAGRRRRQLSLALAPAKAAQPGFQPPSAVCRELVSSIYPRQFGIGRLRNRCGTLATYDKISVKQSSVNSFNDEPENWTLTSHCTRQRYSKQKSAALSESWCTTSLPSWAINISGPIPPMCVLGNSRPSPTKTLKTIIQPRSLRP